MVKTKSKYFITLLITLLLALSSLGLVTVVTAEDGAIFIAYNGSKDIVITDDVLGAFTADTDKGTMITSYNENSFAEIDRVIEGDFEMTFRVNPNERGTGAQFDRKIDFKILDIFFVDATDESNYFAVTIDGNSFWGSNYLKAMASHKDFKGGVNQDAGGAVIAPGSTLNGSFEASSPYDQKTIIKYDADKKQVLGSTYVNHTDPMMTVIADLDNPDHVKEFIFKGFDNGYKIRIRMSGLIEPKNPDRPAKTVIYSLNGQQVNVGNPANTVGPTTSAKLTSKAVKNTAYRLPAAKTYDILSGKGEFYANASDVIKVVDPDENEYTVNKTDKTFVPSMSGDYKVIYTAYDNGGIKGVSKEYDLAVIDSAPEISVKKTYNNRSTVAKGKTFELSSAFAKSDLSLNEGKAVDCFVTVKKGEEVILSERRAETIASVKFDSYGNYSVVYSGRDYLGNQTVVTDNIECRNEPNITFDKLSGEIFVATPFDVPKATAVYNDESAAVKVTITDPYGKSALVTDGQYTPQFNGVYELRYSCAYGEGQSVDEIVVFNVGVKPSAMFYNVKNTTIEPNAVAPLYSMPASGVKLSGAGEGAIAKFSNVIDVTDINKDQTFLEFQITPKIGGKLEFKKLFIYMTDITDPDNKITMEFIVSQWDNRWSYIKAAADKNRLKGVWQEGVPDSDGNYPVLDNFNGGTQLRNSFAGVPYMDTKAKLFKIFYDNTEKALYAEDHLGIKQVVLDFDNPAMVGGGKEWKGFKSGQVEVSFKFAETVGSGASILVSNVAGQKLGGTSIKDETPPSIAVDILKPMPVAMTGRKYKVPSAVAYDIIDGRIDAIDITCFDAGGAEIVIGQDGYLTPPDKGRYTLVYSCLDRSGNQTSVSYDFDCKNALEEINLAFERQPVTQAYVGESVYLPQVSVTGGSYIVKVSRYLIFGDKALKVSDDNTFIPAKEGRYRLMHMVEDYIGNRKEFNNYIDITVSDKPVAYFPSLPKNLINNATYILPSFEAIDYNLTSSDDGYYADTQIKVIYNGVTKVLEADRAFTPSVNATDKTVTVVYTAIGSLGEISKSYTLNVIEPKFADDYFIKTDTVSALYPDAVGFSALNSGAKFEFINSVPSKYIEISFTVNGEKNNFNYADVWFLDAVNSHNSFFVRVYKRDAGPNGFYKTSYAQINGKGLKIEIPGSFYDNSNSIFKIDYDSLTNTVYAFGGSEIGKVSETFDGYALKPFSPTAYTAIEFGAVTGDAEILLQKIINQSFYGQSGVEFQDTTPPIMNIKGVYDKSAKINQQITIFAAEAMDILDPFVTVTVSVQAPDRTYVVPKTDASERIIGLTQYGNYRIVYEAADSSGRKFIYPVLIKVEDLDPPKITVGEISSKLTLGETLTIPEITVEDEYYLNPTVSVFVLTPYGNLVKPVDGKFVTAVKGKHTLIVYAYDGDYSYALYKKDFVVIGG